MKRHNSWRIIAISIVFIFVGLLINGLVGTAEKNLDTMYLADINNVLLNGIVDEYPNIEEEQKVETLTTIWSSLQAEFENIEVFGIVDGRRFSFHSDSQLIDEKIDKDLFDTQRELQKGDGDIDSPYVIWRQSETDRDKYRLYYPLFKNGKVKGMAFLEARKINHFKASINSFLPYLLLLIGAVLVLVIDKFVKRFSFLPGIIVFVLFISLILSVVESNYNNNLHDWNKLVDQAKLDVGSELSNQGIDLTFESEALTTGMPQTINVWKYTLSLLGLLLLIFILTGAMETFVSTLIEYRLAYAYILPAMFGVFLLVFFPFIYGFLIGFTDYNLTNFGGDLIQYFTNLGNYNLGNFYNILKVVNFNDYSNFYFTLAHTIIWTVLNLIFHVSIGIGLALLLNDPKLKGRTFFRILLILPWAIPNYITALIWRGMFHKQFGAVNGLLELLGFEPISWFTQPVTAFLANFATNVWLGFPFMMIIALGALQSIPKELYEASAIDGSSKWQSFWNVTMPLLRPAMVPSIILGTIWTFNQFNVIYLVSGGGPDGATELLITDAYKLAFEQYRYGYAAAYCIVIFLLLLTYGIITSKVTKATKGVYE